MRVLHGMAKSVTSQMGRLGRSWPCTQVRQSRDVVSFRQICSGKHADSSSSPVAVVRKEEDV